MSAQDNCDIGESDIEQILTHKLWSFGPAFERWATAQIQTPGLTPQRLRLLSFLMKNGPQIMAALSEELHVSATNITSMVDAMEKDNLLVRRDHPTDRRARIIDVTDSAREKFETNGAIYKQKIARIFTILSPEERTDLVTIMTKLESFLQNQD